MLYFQTKNPNLGQFWSALEWKSLVYSFVIMNILLPFGTFFGNLAPICFIFPRFGILCQEKSGNPDRSAAAVDEPTVDKPSVDRATLFCL
jgi:hypothetical protein